MWDRFRSATGGGGGGVFGAAAGGGVVSGGSPDQHHAPQGRNSPLSLSFSKPSTSSNNKKNNNNNDKPTTRDPSSNWQPRSSVIAAQQQQQQQQQQQDSNNNGRYRKAAGPPPPRPPRDFEIPPGQTQHQSRPRGHPEQRSQHQHQPSSSSQHHNQQYRAPPRSQTLPVPNTSYGQNNNGNSNGHAHAHGNPHQRHPSRDSLAGRPPSSVYSQPSPLATDFPPPRRHHTQPQYSSHGRGGSGERHYYADGVQPGPDDEVSPPSSPEQDRTGLLPQYDISPIDEEDDYSTPASSRAMSPQHQQPAQYESLSKPALQPAPKMTSHSLLPSQQRAATAANGPNDREQELSRPSSSSSPPPSQRSNIPMMRRERRAQRDAELAANRVRSSDGPGASSASPPSSRITPPRVRAQAPAQQQRAPSREGDKPRGQKNPRWDPMTGEITTSEKGRPSQVKPVEFARGLGISTMASYTPESPPAERERGSSRSGSRAGLHGKSSKTNLATAAAAAGASATDPAALAFSAGSNRPGWKGASGRTAIVDPVRDNTAVAPLKIPPRSAKRTASTEPINATTTTTTNTTTTATGPGSEKKKYNGSHVDSGVAGLMSPPISPESQDREREQALPGGTRAEETEAMQSQQQTGGGSAGKGLAAPAGMSAKSSFANTFRRIMPASLSGSSTTGNNNLSSSQNKRQSRLFSGGPTTVLTSISSAANSPTVDYPSPPLSGTETPTSGHFRSATGDTPATGTTAHGMNVPADANIQVDANAPTNYASLSNVHASSNAPNVPASKPSSSELTPASAAHQHTTTNTAATTRSVPTSTPAPTQSGSSLQPPTTSTTHDYDDDDDNHNYYPSNNSNNNNHLNSFRSTSGSGELTPTTIRRKEVGSAVLTGPFSGKAGGHQPHESFSSSVYSRPDDDFSYNYKYNHNYNPTSNPVPTSNPRPKTQPPNTARLNTKNLPTLPPGAQYNHYDHDHDNDNPNSPYVQPPSRFSTTTYATSANTDSPRPSDSIDRDAPPLPPLPNASHNNNNYNKTAANAMPGTTDPGVLERKRPEMRGGTNKWDNPEPEEEPVKISLSKSWMTTAGANSAGINAQNSPPRTRKDAPKGPRDSPASKRRNDNSHNDKPPAAAGGGGGIRSFGFGFLAPRSPAAASDSNSNSSRPASILSNMDKDLPPAPSHVQQARPVTASAEKGGAPLSTADRIAQLNQTLQDLANRRLNINRAIRQMTELMPQDNLMLPDEVRRKREGEKRKIEELNLKLADIGREEHDLGMKLHRAYKKLDKQTEYEPTTLWVRRATGA